MCFLTKMFSILIKSKDCLHCGIITGCAGSSETPQCASFSSFQSLRSVGRHRHLHVRPSPYIHTHRLCSSILLDPHTVSKHSLSLVKWYLACLRFPNKIKLQFFTGGTPVRDYVLVTAMEGPCVICG